MKLTHLVNRAWGLFAHDLAIDLGTVNSLVYVRGKGIVIREPSAVALHQKTKRILAIGHEARRMMGKTPADIVTIKPLRQGVISDFEVAEALLSHFIQKVHRTFKLWPPKIPRPRVVIGVPSSVTEVERKAVVDAAKRGGARQVFLIEEALAAALGAELPVDQPTGNLIVDVGGGTTEIALISLGGVVAGRSLRVGGDTLDQAIINWAKEKKNLLIGERTAEDLKIRLGSAWPETEKQALGEAVADKARPVPPASERGGSQNRKNKDQSKDRHSVLGTAPAGSDNPDSSHSVPADVGRRGTRADSAGLSSVAETATLRGRDLGSGLPGEIEVTGEELREVVLPVLMRVVLAVREVLEEAPPELLVEVYQDGLVLTGGASQTSGLDRLMAEHTQIPVRRVADPFVSVVTGCARILDDLSLLERLKLYY